MKMPCALRPQDKLFCVAAAIILTTQTETKYLSQERMTGGSASSTKEDGWMFCSK
jgi:hypothetical protein